MRTLLILNPRSRNGATGRRWRKVGARVREALGGPEVELTRGPRDGERIAREAVRAGVERLVVAGGDGTLNEVVSGLLAAELGGYAELAPLPFGTGGDFARTLGLPRDLDDALARLATAVPRRFDAGRVIQPGPDGRERRAWFCNVASFGVSALVDELTARSPQLFGGTAAFAIGTLRALVRYRGRRVAMRVDGKPFFEGPIVLAAAANGRHFGGGMTIGPAAEADDGLLDVAAIPAMSVPALVRRLPGLYDGRYVDDPDVQTTRGRVLELEAEPGEVGMELDGDPRGTLPARVEVLPKALTFLVPKEPQEPEDAG